MLQYATVSLSTFAIVSRCVKCPFTLKAHPDKGGDVEAFGGLLEAAFKADCSRLLSIRSEKSKPEGEAAFQSCGFETFFDMSLHYVVRDHHLLWKSYHHGNPSDLFANHDEPMGSQL